jgi:purine-cytosine permease-like protein
MMMLGWCVLPAAAAALALDSESRTQPARVRVVAAFLIGTLATAGLVVLLDGHVELVLGASVLVSLLLLVVGFFSFSERPGFPKATAADGYRRPGAFRSALMTVTLLAVSGAVFFAVAYSDRHRATGLTIAAPSFVALYLSLGLMVARLTPLKRLGAPQAMRIGFLAATALGIAVPTILSLLTDHRPDRGPAWVVNPLFGMVRFIDRSHLEAEAALLGALALLMTFLALMLLHGEDGVRTNAH